MIALSASRPLPTRSPRDDGDGDDESGKPLRVQI